MLTITSYIGKKTMDSFECSKEISPADFMPLKHDSLTIEVANSQMKKCNDRWFIGAVVIKTTDTELTSFIDWDDIDFIWLGILEMLLAYQILTEASHFKECVGLSHE
ncbi:hypothetical protein G4V62_12080 [Bacillaceae bacterium SIJ1]|uniref:hypothetical protein n=1 Tax=Litoribacterium kuwaitense TaxID=1398745 RepID=UPI0013EE1D5C|nr:hypothetical protein [Litoribacterium kuwaitense]NGP45659.1 hypothetical protein [Litoribacterium kuwaitense]